MQNLAASEPPDPWQHRDPAPSGDPILSARFAVPAVPRILVPRPGLLERLTTGVQGPVTFVSGPAGAGKSVLTAHWVSQYRGPGTVAWLSVEPGDSPDNFWAHVLEALHRSGVRLPAQVDTPLREQDAGRLLLARLAEGLAHAPEPVVLVLDRFDALVCPEVTQDLAFLIRHAAPGLRLVLTSRCDPLLPLHRYRAAGEITEIRNADLRFTQQDTQVLLRGHGLDVGEEDLRTLAERTEGWAAGLRLCALAMQRAMDPRAFIRDFAADRSTIADYLLTEVLDAYPPATQNLLLRVSIIDRIHPDLADALTGDHDGQWTLAALARANAFVEQVNDTAWYRMHPLFAEVLRARLRHIHPDLEPRLRQRAARWLAANGQQTEAVVQASAAADWGFAAQQLVDTLAIPRLLAGPDTDRLTRLLSAMPLDLAGAEPALVNATLCLAQHDVQGCAAALRTAEDQPGNQGVAVKLSASFLAVLSARLSGPYEAVREAAADTRRLLREIPQPLRLEHPELAATVLASLGSAALNAGELDNATATLTAAVDACGQPGTEHPHHDALGSLALVELLQGRLRQAQAYAHNALDIVERSALTPAHHAALERLVLAGAAAEHNELADAQAHLDLVLTTRADLEDVALVEAAVIGARLAAAAGHWAGARAALDRAYECLPADGAPPWAMDELAIAASAVHLAQGQTGAALAALDSVACERPQHTVALARVLLATGRDDSAMQELTHLPNPEPATAPSRVQACLLRVQAAVQRDDLQEAHSLLAQALTLARPEKLRRLFVESGPGVHLLLRENPDLAQAHSWLPAQLLGRHRIDTITELPSIVDGLTDRERDVLNQAARMLSTEEIAAELCVSVNTVKTHLKSAFRKLGVTRRSEAVHRAQALGLL
ncbi:LuxR C-terminal-related transcriptional regulator [Streptomyces sp. RKAG293]|uniref:LuxR C-terminal-related transcriptional regulator n=1 Tax=Streptomyces sp. RKAG293 TaxID=2893403 RepID=UPI002034840D|nr:LuxR C-terminal-related transcriptional regulator [Streptomyces sp. RKAG293]MCM2416709.1 LuxR C-terminal-related transcriptional regulator [Streptomyces sp. RKAG293]